MYRPTKTAHRKRNQCLVTVVLLSACLLVLLTFYHHQTLLNSMINGTRKTSIQVNTSSSNQSTNNQSIRLKTILIWNSPERIESGAEFGTGHQPFIDHSCPISNCFIQTNESSEFWLKATANDSKGLKSFDAVVVNAAFLYFLPGYKRPDGQRFVWINQEAQTNANPDGIIDENPAMFERVFNWTMTYKKNSDIQLPYGRIYPIFNRTQNATKLREERRAVLSNKTGIVSWMVSHCPTTSRREDYVHHLQKHIHVDIYGECGNLSCPRGNHWISYPECYEMLERKYKFYLSFENAFCKEYVTEKFFSILPLNMVPIVFGSADYRSIAPEHSYINALDFESPAKLAEYLHLLDRNDELYLDYFEWKSRYRVEAGMEVMARNAFCDMCAKLNRDDEPKKIYDSLMPDWSARTHCNKLGWRPQNNNNSSV